MSEFKRLPVGFKRLNDNATLPVRAHPTDSGFDLFASEDVIIEPGDTQLVPTGIAVQLPAGTEGQVRPKSGITSKTKLRVQLGTVDNGYNGEVMVIVDNIGVGYDMLGIGSMSHVDTIDGDLYATSPVVFPNGSYIIRKGDKIAQLVVQYLPQVESYEIDGDLTQTTRGDGGFGSSGLRAKSYSEDDDDNYTQVYHGY